MALSSSRLLRLPAEILNSIALATDTPDFLNLRLACRVCEQKSLDAFKVRYINTLTMHLHESALHAAIELVANPVFGPSIKTLRICVDGVNGSPGVCSYKRRLCSCEALSNETVLPQDADVQLLTTLFCCLKQLGQIHSVRTCDLANCAKSPNRHTHILEHHKFIARQQPHFRNMLPRPYALIMEAFDQSQLPVDSFIIECPERALRADWCHQLRQQFPFIPLSLTVQTLTLMISSFDDEGLGRLFPNIAALPRLRSLSITGPERDSSLPPGLFLEHVVAQEYPPCLRSLHVKAEQMRYSGVLEFITQQQSKGLITFNADCKALLMKDRTERAIYPKDLMKHVKDVGLSSIDASVEGVKGIRYDSDDNVGLVDSEDDTYNSEDS